MSVIKETLFSISFSNYDKLIVSVTNAANGKAFLKDDFSKTQLKHHQTEVTGSSREPWAVK